VIIEDWRSCLQTVTCRFRDGFAIRLRHGISMQRRLAFYFAPEQRGKRKRESPPTPTKARDLNTPWFQNEALRMPITIQFW